MSQKKIQTNTRISIYLENANQNYDRDSNLFHVKSLSSNESQKKDINDDVL